MPKAYDYDLRRKVMEAIELNGMKRSLRQRLLRY